MRTPWIALLLLVLTSCRDSGEPPVVDEDILQSVADANQVLFGSQHYISSGGMPRANVEADTAFILEDQGLVKLRDVRVTFFDSSGDTTSVLTSRNATYDWNSGDMTAENDVLVVNAREGRRIETSVLYYNQTEDRIWSDQDTRMIEADGTVVEGTAFESKSDMKEVDLTSAVMTRPGVQRQPTQ